MSKRPLSEHLSNLVEPVIGLLPNAGGVGAPTRRDPEAERIRAIVAQLPDAERCRDGCPGWEIFEIDREPWIEIERCDECAIGRRALELPELMDDDFERLPEAQAALELRMTDALSPNPAAAEMSDDAFVEEMQKLLYDKDPSSVEIIQDALLEREWTLAQLSGRLTSSEHWRAWMDDDDDKADTYAAGVFEITAQQGRLVTEERRLPAHWAPALINGDYSGMDDQEVAEIDAWLGEEEPGNAVDMGEAEFSTIYNIGRPFRGDVATFTFHKYPKQGAEGVAWYARGTSSGKKVYVHVNVYARGRPGRMIPTGARYDTLDQAVHAATRLAWGQVVWLKNHRDADYEGAVIEQPMSEYTRTVKIPSEIVVGTRAKQNPEMGRGYAITAVRDLLTDPDPASLDIARDLLLDNNLKLADVGHQFAVSGSSNFAPKTRGWAGDFVDGASGELVLSKAEEVNDPDYIAIVWMIWKVAKVNRDKPGMMNYSSEIEINYRGARWSETRNGVASEAGPGMMARTIDGSTARRLRGAATRRADAATDGPLAPLGVFGGSSIKTAERNTIDMVWQIARVLKELHGESPAAIQQKLRERVKPKQTPVAIINPRENPPWVTHALADAFESLSSQVPPAWLPKLDAVRGGPRGTLVAEMREHGCGAYGCVLPTLDPAIVLKVTTDETEAEFASQLAHELVAPICVDYRMAVSLAARRDGHPIYLLWREAADDVGEVGRVLGPVAARLVETQHQAAQRLFLALRDSQPKKHTIRELGAAWEVTCEDLASEVPELATLAGGMLEVFRTQRIFFGDVHAGNLGRVFRGGDVGEWVITDPGHVAVIR